MLTRRTSRRLICSDSSSGGLPRFIDGDDRRRPQLETFLRAPGDFRHVVENIDRLLRPLRDRIDAVLARDPLHMRLVPRHHQRLTATDLLHIPGPRFDTFDRYVSPDRPGWHPDTHSRTTGVYRPPAPEDADIDRLIPRFIYSLHPATPTRR